MIPSGTPAREAVVACELFGISENSVQVTLESLTIEALLEGAGRGSYQLGPLANSQSLIDKPGDSGT